MRLDTKNRKKKDSMLSFALKAILLCAWTTLFFYPAAWNLLISDSVYHRFNVWRIGILKIDAPILPFVDIAHRLVFPAHNAAIKSRLDRLGNIENLSSQLNVTDYFGYTPLAYSVIGRNEKEVSFFIEAGSNPDALLRNNQTALFIAISRNLEKICLLLLAKGARSEIVDIRGTCAMHLAIQQNMANVVSRMISLEHSLETRDGNNLLPLDQPSKTTAQSGFKLAWVCQPEFSYSYNPDISIFHALAKTATCRIIPRSTTFAKAMHFRHQPSYHLMSNQKHFGTFEAQNENLC
jgi:hypothetical protein